MTKNEKKAEKYVVKYFSYNYQTGKIINIFKRCCKTIIGDEPGSVNDQGYIVISVNNSKIRAHRLAWRLYYGEWPKLQIDHINGVRDDNRISNLRETSQRENGQNKVEHRNGHLVGTCFYKDIKKYAARIRIKHIKFHLGFYNNPQEAHQQYLKALKAIEKREFKTAKELRDYLATTDEST